ncbi:hypothetical protein L2E82_44980 [Cichorium intybus]|uniref:Uncharacterized protein n=1 Tax=Cichorium intybus TaxID=13427 RepID=A0ACB8ZRM5_CICIN|nr:hypothetical protein L2E82_44980 [Cichorium intybus]
MKETTETVQNLQSKVLTFVKDFRETHDTNNAKMNKVISGFGESLKAEKEALSVLRFDLKKENSELASSLDLKVEQLKKDLAMENEVMDQLAVKTTKIKVLKADLNHSSTVLASAVSQNKAHWGCATDIDSSQFVKQVEGCFGRQCHSETRGRREPGNSNEYMETSNPNENVDTSNVSKENPTKPPFPFTIISNVNEPETNPSADETNQEKKTNWFASITSDKPSPSIRKGKNIGDDNEEEYPELINAAKSAKEAKDKELDDLQRLARELDAKEAAARDADFLLKTRKSLFPDCSFDRMVEEAIKELVINWL